MSFVIKICTTPESGQIMKEIESAKVIKGKGIINDRYFEENNDKDTQITLIESENIDQFNENSETNFEYIDFRRNIITQGIKLNELIGKYIMIGSVKLKAHSLCHPCKYLQEHLKQNNLVKNLLDKGGLRCEIISDGIIKVQDEIKIL